jgi:NTE family protein
MSGPAGWRPDFYSAARRYSSRLLAREVRALQAGGAATVVFTPGAREQQLMGNDMMARNRLNEVIGESFLAAGRRAATPALVDLIRIAAAAG